MPPGSPKVPEGVDGALHNWGTDSAPQFTFSQETAPVPEKAFHKQCCNEAKCRWHSTTIKITGNRKGRQAGTSVEVHKLHYDAQGEFSRTIPSEGSADSVA